VPLRHGQHPPFPCWNCSVSVFSGEPSCEERSAGPMRKLSTPSPTCRGRVRGSRRVPIRPANPAAAVPCR
jgi:hypothetical protein